MLLAAFIMKKIRINELARELEVKAHRNTRPAPRAGRAGKEDALQLNRRRRGDQAAPPSALTAPRSPDTSRMTARSYDERHRAARRPGTSLRPRQKSRLRRRLPSLAAPAVEQAAVIEPTAPTAPSPTPSRPAPLRPPLAANREPGTPLRVPRSPIPPPVQHTPRPAAPPAAPVHTPAATPPAARLKPRTASGRDTAAPRAGRHGCRQRRSVPRRRPARPSPPQPRPGQILQDRARRLPAAKHRVRRCRSRRPRRCKTRSGAVPPGAVIAPGAPPAVPSMPAPPRPPQPRPTGRVDRLTDYSRRAPAAARPLAGQPAARPLFRRVPTSPRSLPSASPKAGPGQPAPASPMRPPSSSPVPGQPIYRGPIRPGQPVIARSRGASGRPGGPPQHRGDCAAGRWIRHRRCRPRRFAAERDVPRSVPAGRYAQREHGRREDLRPQRR